MCVQSLCSAPILFIHLNYFVFFYYINYFNFSKYSFFGSNFSFSLPLCVCSIRPKKRKGFCRTPPECRDGMVYWPQDSKCYTLHTRGPCPKGKLFVMGKNRLAECKVRLIVKWNFSLKYTQVILTAFKIEKINKFSIEIVFFEKKRQWCCLMNDLLNFCYIFLWF